MGLDRQLLAGRREPAQPLPDAPPVSMPPPVVIPATEQATTKDSTIERYHDSNNAAPVVLSMTRTVRKAVRERGNEQSIYRLTREEKRALKDLVYTYGVAGTKTSENEIVRIAINYLLSDHKQRGDESVLAQVLAAMNE